MKSIYANQLAQYLSSKCRHYVLVGQEPLLLQDSSTQIRKAFQKEGFDTRLVFTLESSQSFDWQGFTQALNTPSLFANKQIIEWIWHTPLQDKDLSILKTLNPLPEIVRITQTSYLTKKQMQTKWFKALAADALVIQHWLPQGPAWTAWIQQRAKNSNLELQPQALNFLAQHFEGQLFAIDQCMTKLALADPQAPVDLEAIQDFIFQQPQGDLFSLQTALLRQKPDKLIELLIQLKQAKLEMSLILWCVHRVLRALYQAKCIEHEGAADPLRKMGFLPKDHTALRHLAQQNTEIQLKNCLQRITKIDKLHKTGQHAECWQKLMGLCLNLIGVTTHSMKMSI